MSEKGKLTQEEVEALLGDVEQAPTEEMFRFSELSSDDSKQTVEQAMNMQLLLDIPLEIVVELGSTKKKISDVLELTSGSILDLDKMAGEAVDLFVNKKRIAKGEVVVVDEHFGVRITEILQSPLT
ncbi:flagellar motor switch protein FliN [Bacillus sp. B15-48]|nr:flagellar motor switch protein FliN [Bacillus sp. B15-48]